MPLSIIGVGLPRTGTLSLKRAIETLGRGPCFHPSDASADAHNQAFRLLDPSFRNWDEAYRGFDAAVDSPAALFYAELCSYYPHAKIILTVREESAWIKSINVLKRLLVDNPNAHQILGRLRSGEFGLEISTIFGSDSNDRTLQAYRQYNHDVKNRISSNRLLTFQVEDGWSPLCRFLGITEPTFPFPVTHSSAELIKEHTSGTPPSKI